MEFAEAIGHYFFPRYSNNHKAKLIHSTTLVVFALLLIVYQLSLQAIPLTGIKILGYAANIPPEAIIELTNQKRNDNGVPPLVYSAQLSEAARLKGEHMLALDYWAHVAPDGTEPWKFFNDVGYKYRYAGENLARDFSNPTDAINAWMASPTHRDNMLSTKYKEIGVAVVEGDLGGVETTIIVQLFGTKLSDSTPELAQAEAKTVTSPAFSPKTISPTPTPTPISPQSVSPTLAPVIVQTSPSPNQGGTIAGPSQRRASPFQILISPFESTRGVAIATTLLLLIVLVIDSIIVAKRKIPRLGGRTFAHIAFLGMILVIILIAKAGRIL